jgi:hypothetical protein
VVGGSIAVTNHHIQRRDRTGLPFLARERNAEKIEEDTCMPSNKKPDWEVKAYGEQHDQIDADLMVQLVIMLGHQLAEEADNNENEGGNLD